MLKWSLSAYNSDGETNFLINSEFSSNQSDTGLGSYFKAQDLKFNIHSHPDKDGTKGGSGYIQGSNLYVPNTDADVVNYLYNKLNGKTPSMYVYHRFTQNIYQYTPWKPNAKIWNNIQTGRKMQSILNK